MAVGTFVAYGGVYSDLAHAEADYELVKDLHTQAGLLDAYDAAVIQRRADGKVKIVKQHETPTRVGGVLDARQAGLVVVGISDMGARIEQAMQHADRLQSKQLKADTAEIERDAKAAGAEQAPAGN